MAQLRLLTVEDDAATANEIIDELKKCGFEVDWTDNAVKYVSPTYRRLTAEAMYAAVAPAWHRSAACCTLERLQQASPLSAFRTCGSWRSSLIIDQTGSGRWPEPA